jgi:hypothetical protein
MLSSGSASRGSFPASTIVSNSAEERDDAEALLGVDVGNAVSVVAVPLPVEAAAAAASIAADVCSG